MKNEELPSVQPLSEYLFKQSKPTLDKIDNIRAIEQSLFSNQLGVAGTVDCIAEYEGELAIIDFKTARNLNLKSGSNIIMSSKALCFMCFYEMTGITVKKFVIIMSCEDGECVVYEQYDKSKYIKLLTEYIREFVQFKLQNMAKTRTQCGTTHRE